MVKALSVPIYLVVSVNTMLAVTALLYISIYDQILLIFVVKFIDVILELTFILYFIAIILLVNTVLGNPLTFLALI